MEEDRWKERHQGVWELRSAVMETRLWAEEVRARSWQVRAESRRQRLARWMAGANPLTMAVTAWIITQRQLW